MGGGDGYQRPRPSWGCTLVVQAALCVALYAAFSIGRPGPDARLGRESLDMYFISVVGGSRPPKEQTRLLQQMEKTMKTYKAKFVVNIGKLGEDDPLAQNGTLQFPLLKIPCGIAHKTIPCLCYNPSEYLPRFTTSASHGKAMRNFFKKINISHKQVLDIIAVDTGPLQKDLLQSEQLSEAGRNQLHWIQSTLASTDSDWRIVIGFDPLIVCEEEDASERVELYEPLHHIFLKYGVNAYMSQQGCFGYHYQDRGITYIGNPGSVGKGHTNQLLKENPDIISQMHDGFLLHRVSPLEIESYFVDSAGIIVHRSTIHQPGRGTM